MITNKAVAEALSRLQQDCGHQDEDDIVLICTAGQDSAKWQFVSFVP